MLALPHTNSWGFVYTNQANGSFTPGTSVAPGASNVEGSWVEIGPDASITTDIHYVTIFLFGGATSGQAKPQILDLGWDPAGGTSYVAWMSNLVMGCSGPFQGANGSHGRPYHFPCRIPAGSAIAVRIQGANATAGTVLVLAYFYGKPSRPELWRPAAYTETIGAITNSDGVAFTPGNAGWGAWASLGTTTKSAFWAQLGAQCNNNTITGEMVKVQLGIGDGTNMHTIIDSWINATSFEATSHEMQQPCTWEIPAGAELWVRGNASGAPSSGYNATAVLFGG